MTSLEPKNHIEEAEPYIINEVKMIFGGAINEDSNHARKTQASGLPTEQKVVCTV